MSYAASARGFVLLLGLGTGSLAAQPAVWTPLGPAPIAPGQAHVAGQAVAGAVQAIAPHPTNAAILWIGSVNGGIWKSSNATAQVPGWTRQTDARSSLSISDIDIDPLDATANTLLAGVGRYSSYGRRGGRRTGALRSTDGGTTWTELSSGIAGANVVDVAARGTALLVAVDTADSNSCGDIGLYRSTNSGAAFAKVAVAPGFPSGGALEALAADPANPAVFYAALTFAQICASNGSLNGIYRSTNTGATWSKVSSLTMDALFDPRPHVEIAVGSGGGVAVALSRSELLEVFHSPTGVGGWTALGLPFTTEGGQPIGLHPGGQGFTNLSVAVDPANPNLVYIGGDRQPKGSGDAFPNSIGASDFTGRLFRGNAAAPAGSRWTPLTDDFAGGRSAPHADSRDLRFDAAGRLLEADDGGVYARLSPQSATGSWFGLNGNLATAEQHSAAFEALSNVMIAGHQDNGTARQQGVNDQQWSLASGGDGGDVAIDALLLAAQQRSLVYTSFQNLAGFHRRTFSPLGQVALELPQLFVTSGPPLDPQFLTPVSTNLVAGGRVVVGGTNGVYESVDRGDTIGLVPAVVVGTSVRATRIGTQTIVYGGLGNPSLLFVAGCRVANEESICDVPADIGLFRRTAAGGPLALVHTARTGSDVVAVAIDPDDPQHLFAVESPTAGDGARILRSVDGGNGWSTVTGDLPAVVGRVEGIAYVPGTSADALAIGTQNGVYAAGSPRGFDNWTRLGSELPNAPVFSLEFDRARGLLYAATLGRGSFSLGSILVAPVAANDALDARMGFADSVDVVANDTDTGGSVDRTTVTVVAAPGGGATASVHPVTGVVTYTPPTGFVGTQTFTYRVRDDLGLESNTATVIVSVTATLFRNGFE